MSKGQSRDHRALERYSKLRDEIAEFAHRAAVRRDYGHTWALSRKAAKVKAAMEIMEEWRGIELPE